MPRRHLLLTTLLALASLTVTAAASASEATSAPRVINGCLTSVPDPGTTEPVRICYTLFKPAERRRVRGP